MKCFRPGRGSIFARALLLLALIFPCHRIYSDDGFGEHRILVGLKLFRTMVSADLNIQQKTNKDGELSLVVAWAYHEDEMAGYRDQLQQSFQTLGNLPVKVNSYSVADIVADPEKKFAAIFIGQTLSGGELEKLIRYCIDKKIILFSPFEGDVEQGVLGGLSVQATVRPLINIKALEKSGINIKPFYLKVAKQYE